MGAQYAIEAVVVLAVLVTVAAVAAGFGDRLAPAWRDARPLVLPAGRRLRSGDLMATRFAIAFRGYRMAEVDLVLDRLAAELAERDAELETLRAALGGAAEQASPGISSEPGSELGSELGSGVSPGIGSGLRAGRAPDEPAPPPPPHGGRSDG